MAKLAIAAADIKVLIHLELINTGRHLKPRWILAILTDVQWITSFTHICIKVMEIFRNSFTKIFFIFIEICKASSWKQ